MSDPWAEQCRHGQWLRVYQERQAALRAARDLALANEAVGNPERRSYTSQRRSTSRRKHG